MRYGLVQLQFTIRPSESSDMMFSEGIMLVLGEIPVQPFVAMLLPLEIPRIMLAVQLRDCSFFWRREFFVYRFC